MSGHTKGPWVRHLDAEGGAFVSGGGTVIADMVGPPEFREANASLISAATEMLEALHACTSLIRSQNGNRLHGVNDILEMARAAIAKAEGQP